jgi:cytochrome c553
MTFSPDSSRNASHLAPRSRASRISWTFSTRTSTASPLEREIFASTSPAYPRRYAPDTLPGLWPSRPRIPLPDLHEHPEADEPVLTPEWRQLSAAVTARDGVCVECGSTRHLQAHHDVARAEGGADAPENLVTLCASCHARLEAERRRVAS